MTASPSDRRDPGGPWKLIADDSLSLALFGLFLVCIAAQSATGWRAYDDSLTAARLPTVGYAAFLLTGTFQNAVFSNWQAAVLQLAVLIGFSSVLRQRGAAHSRKSDGEKTEADARGENPPVDDEGDDRPVRPTAASRRRVVANLQLNPFRKNWLYNNSLSLAMFGLFIVFFALHPWTSDRAYNEEQALRHLGSQALLPYLGSANLWFNTLQTWEAEFFAIGLYVVLSIFLRQERSPESKKTGASDEHTGDANE